MGAGLGVGAGRMGEGREPVILVSLSRLPHWPHSPRSTTWPPLATSDLVALLASIVGGKQGEEGWECKCWPGHEEASATSDEIFYQVLNV